MAEEKNYHVIIENRTAENPTPVSTSASSAGDNEQASPVTPTSVNKGGSFLSNVMVSTNVIKPYIQQAASFGISQIEMDTGSAAMQRQYQAYSSIGSSASAIVTAGIMGGPAAMFGAAGMMVLQSMIQAEFTRQAINNQKQLEQESISLRKSRIGMSMNKSRGGGVV